MPDKSERKPPRERAERLLQQDDYEDERERLRVYYPNLRSDVIPRDWDEPPWGRKEGARVTDKGRRD